MEKRYNPQPVERKWYKFWEEKGFFNAQRKESSPAFCIVIPPPNITGILHMGHALNNTIQDVLIRYKRMQGFISLWMPGTDHAGIATQNVVEKELARQGLRKEDIGREEFIRKLWAWTDRYGSTIISQLKQLGASCDWRRTRFTMDEGYSEAVKEVFVRLYRKGLIYKGKYIINWCPRCKTALADEEAPYRELEGWLYYIRYPVKGSNRHIVVATTRPETLLGDTAVAINPQDERFKWLEGKVVFLPLINRELKVIKDELVSPDFGTGIVKVTPAHDKYDFIMAKRHNLEFINIMDEEGVLTPEAKLFVGEERFSARQKILEVLQKQGFLEKKEPYRISVGHCYRCDTIVEPRLSSQWFVRMKPLAEPAIRAVEEDKIKFYPSCWKKVYLNWMYNIEDWCISRQIWWGHRIPVYYCRNCYDFEEELFNSGEVKGVIVSTRKPSKCPRCGGEDIYQDEDVLDTWFSSWLWPFATFGWPFNSSSLKEKNFPDKKGFLCREEEFTYFYPTDVLVTASEILFFWVARMIMAGLEFIGEIPFRTVLIHGTVRDAKGVKMSKSLGNIIDPLEIIEKFGADALRFSLMLLGSSGSDIYLSEKKFQVGRNFANKIWNACRYILEKIGQKELNFKELSPEKLTLAEEWILKELETVAARVGSFLEEYRINEVAKLLYDFFWHKFCDWYIEISKIESSFFTDHVLILVLERFLRLLHPLMPFITEEIWQRLRGYFKEERSLSIMVSPWPGKIPFSFKRDSCDFLSLKELVSSIRAFKKDLNIQQKAKVLVVPFKEKGLKILKSNLSWIKFIARIEELQVEEAINVEKELKENAVSTVTSDFRLYILADSTLDLDAYIARLNKRRRELQERIKRQEEKLANPSFLKKAPPEIVEKHRGELGGLKQELDRLEKIEYRGKC